MSTEEFLNPQDQKQDRVSTDDSELNHYFDRMNLEITRNTKKDNVNDNMYDTTHVIHDLVKQEDDTAVTILKLSQVHAPDVFGKMETIG